MTFRLISLRSRLCAMSSASVALPGFVIRTSQNSAFPISTGNKRRRICLSLQKKTTARLHIELNKYALAILDKYDGVGLPNDKALPVISNVKMNENLHDAAQEAGIDEPVNIVSYIGSERSEVVVPKYSVLTTHAGRRTFYS